MEVSTIEVDLTKNVFQAHGADAATRCFRKRLPRKVLAFFANQPSGRVATTACAARHGGARSASSATRFA